MRAPAKIYMRKNSLLRKDAPACLPEKFANPDADFYAITGLQGIAGIAVNEQHYPTANSAATPFIRPEFLNDPVLFPPPREMLRAEVLMPLSPAGTQLHEQIWQRYLAAPGLTAEH